MFVADLEKPGGAGVFGTKGDIGKVDAGEDGVDVRLGGELGDGVLDGAVDGFEDRNAMNIGHGAEEKAAAVEIVDFVLREGLMVERRARGNVGDGEGELAAETHVVGHFGDGGDAAGFVVDDEEEELGSVFGAHLFGFAGSGPGVEGELGIVERDASGCEGRDGDVAAPGGAPGGAAEEDLRGHDSG